MSDIDPREAALDYFGKVLMERLRDRAVADWDRTVARTGADTASQRRLWDAVESIPKEHRPMVREAVIEAIDSAIHDWLAQLEWESTSKLGRIKVMVDGLDVSECSDAVREALHYETTGDESWCARFSAHGLPYSWRHADAELKELWGRAFDPDEGE
ncbi:MAG: hypothetical protein ACYTGX_11515 [Planctomycetota bacterium]|jgi:hypothetical protein